MACPDLPSDMVHVATPGTDTARRSGSYPETCADSDRNAVVSLEENEEEFSGLQTPDFGLPPMLLSFAKRKTDKTAPMPLIGPP